ncbi:fimbrial chaperone protein [Serratia marcescens]|jgi:minor fimbrial subunit|uniref:fimbrial protein n=1 Tax=Serratia TaxID=613 RepID=UPI000745168D|nr:MULTISPECIES: fimbrial protein [Serratia]MBL0876171.1 fimbrial protein [Serratia nevei]AQT65147.1 fimbrial protein [Serratia marcescens]ASL89126.1 fimbrial protein [Serratia marcescens]ELI8816860.1 fimbrial protein [Serratia marcescens]ELI8846696.1 fimbrial protein [Serratia marcescens]
MTLVSKLNKVLKKKEVAALVASVCLMAYSSGANAFACKDATGNVINSSSGGGAGTFTVYANLTPSVQAGQNLVVDLNSSISCRNELPQSYIDWVALNDGSAYGGALENFTGTVKYYNSSYPLPVTNRTKETAFTTSSYQPWNVMLFLKPISAASGVLINKGSLIARLNMYKYSTNPQTGQQNGTIDRFTWNIYANNTVVVPTGGCDVSSRNVTVTLPDYPGTAAVPLTVHCGQNQQLAYYLTGTTADTASTIFTNTSSSNPATGVGVQLSNRNGIVATNKNVSLGTVGTSPQSLGLTASYARINGQVVAGNVQSIIGVTFVYE